MFLKNLYHALLRQKTITEKNIEESKLKRVLTTLDLTALGVGATLGVGIYVLAGEVAREKAGPAVIISFLIAAVVSGISGICYAEFGARVPKAGSAYIFSYFTVGEFIAFVIGWNLILEYVIGAASVAKGVTTYIDNLVGGSITEALTKAMPMHVDFFGLYPDFFGFSVVMVVCVGLAFGMKESSRVNSICTAINLTVVAFIVVAGAFKADTSNWQIPVDVNISKWINNDDNTTEIGEIGTGGFAPFGITGIISGAATCFYGFLGFDCVATLGEECKTPHRSIPLAIVFSLIIILASYLGVSTILTLMWPYFLQDSNAPLSYVFEQVGWDWARWTVTIGAIFGLVPSLMGSLFPLPRVIYAMANDGLIFSFLGHINERFKSPMVGTILSGFLTALMTLLFDLNQLVNMMSIGTLMAYTMVSACVLILRYRKTTEDNEDTDVKQVSSVTRQLFNLDKLKVPTDLSGSIVTWLVISFVILSLICMCFVAFMDVDSKHSGTIILIAVFGTCMILNLIFISLQPVSRKKLFFMVPLVPITPAIAIVANLYLMLNLDVQTWIRFGVWMIIGLAIYFGYGIWNSHERVNKASQTRI